MKLTSQEEYGLRLLLQIARMGPGGAATIPVLSAIEGLSKPYTAKLLRALRRGGFLKSARGQVGGYQLARAPEEIVLGDVLATLGGRLYDDEFCNHHSGHELVCTNALDCSIRSLWRGVQSVVDHLLRAMTLQDLMHTEDDAASRVDRLVRIASDSIKPLQVPAPRARG